MNTTTQPPVASASSERLGRCATCKYWRRPENDWGEVPGTGLCKKVPQFWVVTQWTADSDKRELRPEYAEHLAFVQDGSDYRAELKTMPAFGCVQHETA